MFWDAQDVKRYSTFEEMLEIEGLSSVLPEVTTIKEGRLSKFHFYQCILLFQFLNLSYGGRLFSFEGSRVEVS